jgi:hypothetical protein
MKLLKIVVINLLLVFVLFEGGMRLYYGITDKIPPHSDHSVFREWRWVKQRLADGKVKFDSRFVHDQYAGWKNAPNVNTQDPYGNRIRTNSQGMRNEQEFAVDKAGSKRLLIIGDSYSFGHGVSDDETYAHVLNNRHMPDWQVMNLAVSATGTDQQYLMYAHYGEQFSPDIVLLGFYVRDFNRNTFSFRDYAKPLYIPNEDGSLTLTHSPVLSPQELIAQYQNGQRQIGGWHYSYAWAVFGKHISNAVKRDRSPGSLPRRTLSGIMEKLVTRARANGTTPVWVNFPVRQITRNKPYRYDQVADFAMSEAKRLGMPALDLKPVLLDYLRQQPDAKLWRPRDIGGHFSVLGNEVAAQAIYEFLNNNKLLTDTGKQQ